MCIEHGYKVFRNEPCNGYTQSTVSAPKVVAQSTGYAAKSYDQMSIGELSEALKTADLGEMLAIKTMIRYKTALVTGQNPDNGQMDCMPNGYGGMRCKPR